MTAVVIARRDLHYTHEGRAIIEDFERDWKPTRFRNDLVVPKKNVKAHGCARTTGKNEQQ